ncbi:efflux RND transporter periplasmic adaptor subunit [Undibacterium oligocarboniphilum]|uniref:Efflux RND transporter periplasmic adaptor subunit n=1 Tax=Undibacterium oligocarboniphilum TaxID=666702 RepID=A0A850QN70_9BURK|nr:efflux RND transporter periplasmic adaptor subunit [Undibacterium oligocarboniphilum]MBC3869455.1 efflux RND transporter periplasmic adaptor subunit [Undibacterium oligocarboniphilum]NVO77834.1 efflux RND transporter periplasmic adaptor subunit [Undibacterium oligocarboniphilum]
MLTQKYLALAIVSVFAITACSKDNDKNQQASSASTSASASASSAKPAATDAKAAAPVKLLIAPEDVLKVESNALASGPVITGSIQPERKADLRAEVSTIVLQVLKENGDAVKKGDVLVRLDETAIRDNLNSADDAARSAALALDQSDRALQRLKTLRASGMTSLQAMDDAEVKVNAARSELSAAKARAVTARQQLQRTVVRAPFDGVVSERKVSAGDTAAIGKELVKVIDPASMRFAGHVSTDKIAQVRTGQPVSFRINGYGNQEFRGKITRVDPAANDVTRQVEVLVAFADSSQPRVSGLYAEGNIESTTVNALTLPEAAVVKSGDQSYAWRVTEKTLKRVSLNIGKRDQRTGNYEVRSGLTEGDIVMRSPNSSFKDGQAIEMAAAKLAVANAAGTTDTAKSLDAGGN